MAPSIRQPIPIQRKLDSRSYSFSPRQSSPLINRSSSNEVYGTLDLKIRGSSEGFCGEEDAYSAIEKDRANLYGLDLPITDKDSMLALMDPESSSFFQSSIQEPDLQTFLPYELETLHDKARYLSHIVSHLYIAVKSLDLQGALSITAKELEETKGSLNVHGVLEPFINQHDTAALDHPTFEDDSSEGEDSELDEDEEIDTGRSTPVNKVPSISAAIINARHWSIELKTLILMKFPIPIALRASLVKVYYAICLAQGQGTTSDIFLEVFQKLIDEKKLLKEFGLTLDWEVAYRVCIRSFPHENSQYDNYDKDYFKRLLNICFVSNAFFKGEAVSQIFSNLLSLFSTSNGSLTLSCLYGLVPMHFEEVEVEDKKVRYHENDVRRYVSSLFHIWSSVTKSESVDLHLVALLSRLSEYALLESAQTGGEKNIEIGKFGIFDETQFATLLEILVSSLNIAVMKPSRHPSSFYQSFANLLIFSITDDSSFEEKSALSAMKIMLNSLRSFVHPSNTGPWTSILSKLIHSIISLYHKRLQMEKDDPVNNIVISDLQYLREEYKLNQYTHTTLAEMVLPLIQTGIQSKKDSVVNQYISSLSVLCYIQPEFVLDKILIDAYSSLETINSSHRLRVVLKELAAVIRYMGTLPLYRVHVIRLLTEVLPGIDSNDLVKSVQTLHLIGVTASFFPFADLSHGSIASSGAAYDFTQQHIAFLEESFYLETSLNERVTFLYDPEYEREAFISSTSCFNDFLKVLCERLFLLLEYLPDPKKTSGLEAKIVQFVPRTFHILVESLSDDCFSYLANQIFSFLEDKVLYTISDAVGGILAAIVKRDPKSQFPKYLSFLSSKIVEEINENGAGSSRGDGDVTPPDQPLFWYTILLASVISQAGETVVEYSKDIELVYQLLLTSVQGPVSMVTSLVQYNLLNTISTTRLRESRFLSPVGKTKIDESSWGSYQFTKERFSEENLTFDWHVPNKSEIQYAILVFESSTNKIMENINQAMNVPKNQDATKDLVFSDKFGISLLSLGHCIAGISHLFDPAYKEIDEDASKPSTLKRKLDSLDFLRRKYGSSDALSLSKFSPVAAVSEFSGSPVLSATSEQELESSPAPVEAIDLTHNEDFVELNHIDEDVVLDDESSHISEIPISNRLSPSPSRSGRDDFGESLNAVLSFKSRKIYYSNYYFGEGKHERDLNPEYLKLHELRDNIGRFLHKVHLFLVENHQNNTKLIKIFLHTLKIWICDVGNETVLNLNSSASLKFEYLESIQYIRRIRTPYSRITFGLLLEKYHRQRVSLFSGSRIATSLDKLLLVDVAELSASIYSGISSSAVSTLGSSMKVLLGSYEVVLRSLIQTVQRAIILNDDKTVRHALYLLNSKRFKGRLPSDFKNLPDIVGVLHDCMLMESNVLVSTAASEVFSNIVNKLKIPSSVCDIKEDYLEAIRPPDEYAQLEVKAVRTAKEKKRQTYFNNLNILTERILKNLSPTKFWKVNYFNLSLLINVQCDMEVPLHKKVLETLVKFTVDSHPSIFRLCLKGIYGVLTKITTLSSFNYDLKFCYTSDHDPNESIQINTEPSSSNGGNFSNTFQNEMSNFENPTFFIDNKSNFSWLFWGKSIRVVENKPNTELNLRENEKVIIQGFGSSITTDWILNLLKMLVQEAENDEGFHTNDVRLVSLIVHLTSAGLTPFLSGDEWFDLIRAIYVPADKETHLVLCEILAGLLISNSHASPSFAVARDVFAAEMLQKVLGKDITLETRGIWVVFSWWLPGNADIRRFPHVAQVLLKFEIDKQSDSSFKEATSLVMIKHLVASTSYRFPYTKQMVENCFDNLDHPYQLVREQISSLLTALFMITPIDPYPNFESFIQSNDVTSVGDVYPRVSPIFHDNILKLFEKLKVEKSKITHLSVQESLKTPYIYISRSVLKFLKSVIATSASAGLTPYLSSHIFPFLIELSEMREVCMLAGIFPQQTLIMLSYIPYRKDRLGEVVDFIVSFDIDSTVWHNLQVLGLFTQLFYLKQYLALSDTQQKEIFNFVLKLLFHGQLEVRETAAKVLTGIIHLWGGNDVKFKIVELQKKFSKILTKNKKISSKDKSSDQAFVKLHGATLGLGAIVEAFPYVSPIPEWLPLILTTLANRCSNIPGKIGKTAKDSLSKFKKNRQDTWHIDAKFFTQDQLQDLEGVLWTSYFV